MTNLYKKCINIYFLLMCLAACRPLIPATTPPQLDYTPGVMVQITDERVLTPTFSSAYPDGWRVIKISTAGEPLRFVFASPDDSILITLSQSPLENTATPDPNRYTRLETLEDRLIIYGETSREQQTLLDQHYEFVLDSIDFRG